MSDKVVAIHQPNFFPWLGFFDKIIRSDIFVFLDDVQFPKKGGAWANRVKLLIAGEARWVTAAIERNYSGTRSIQEMQFQSKTQWREKFLKSIEMNYRRHPFFEETIKVVESLVQNFDLNIAKYNIHAITCILRELGVNTEKLRCSSDFNVQENSNEMLCVLTSLNGGSIYMCGGGAEEYQDELVFVKHGLKLQYQNFSHPVYPQYNRNNFISGLSVIDAAMNLGWRGVGKMLSNHLP